MKAKYLVISTLLISVLSTDFYAAPAGRTSPKYYPHKTAVSESVNVQTDKSNQLENLQYSIDYDNSPKYPEKPLGDLSKLFPSQGKFINDEDFINEMQVNFDKLPMESQINLSNISRSPEFKSALSKELYERTYSTEQNRSNNSSIGERPFPYETSDTNKYVEVFVKNIPSDQKEVTKKIVQEPINQRIRFISFLEDKADRVLLNSIQDMLGEQYYPNPKSKIEEILNKMSGGIVVFFGHVDGAKFVTENRMGEAIYNIEFSEIQRLAILYNIEAIFLGCETYNQGASVGYADTITTQELPRILSSMNRSKTKYDLWSSMAETGKDVYVNSSIRTKEAISRGIMQFIVEIGSRYSVYWIKPIDAKYQNMLDSSSLTETPNLTTTDYNGMDANENQKSNNLDYEKEQPSSIMIVLFTFILMVGFIAPVWPLISIVYDIFFSKGL